jgi:hypothetical protein
MSESIAIHHHRLAGHGRGRRHPLLLGVFFALVIGALGFAIAVSTVGVVRAALASQAAADAASAALPVVEYPARELPKEWSTWEMGVEVDHMYRQKQSPKLDWIREGGRR